MPDAIKDDAPAPNGLPDLNDTNTHLSRADAMAVMRQRRRESIAEEMDEATATAFLGEAAPITAADPNADPDADPDAAVAEAARKELEAKADDKEDVKADGPIDADKQVDAQLAEETVLSDEDLSRYKVRVKVNGEERLVSLSEMRAAAQKTESADRYLAEAKGLLAEVKSVQQAGVQSATPIEPEKTTEGDPIDAAVESLFQGDEATAKRLFKEAVTRRSDATPAAPGAEQVARQVEQRIVIRSALRQFAKDHKDITADPTLRRVADTFLLEETGGRPLDELEPDQIPEALDRAGTRTKEWIRKMAGVAPTQQRATTRDEKRALKADIDELPAAGTRAGTTVPQPKTNSDRIAEMAAARGQVLRSA